MSSRYDNDSEDVVQENKKQTEAHITRYIRIQKRNKKVNFFYFSFEE